MRLRGYAKIDSFQHRRSGRRVVVALYVVALAIYLYIGFQPVDAQPAINYSTDRVSSSFATYNTLANDVATNDTLSISSIELVTPVEQLQLTSNRTLETPDTIAGSYSIHQNKTLIIGHSSTVFHNLSNVRIGDTITYRQKDYRIIRREIVLKESISMSHLLKEEKDDLLVLMTCAGQTLKNRDATHRLLVTAIEIKTRSA